MVHIQLFPRALFVSTSDMMSVISAGYLRKRCNEDTLILAHININNKVWIS